MAEVFAGFVAGYGMALLTTPLLALFLLRIRAGSVVLSRLLPPGVNLAGISILLHGALAMFWTAVGIILGLLLLALRGGGEFAGSINAPFTLMVASFTLFVAAPVFALIRPLRKLIASYAVLAVLVFGWLMPYLARWSRFDSG